MPGPQTIHPTDPQWEGRMMRQTVTIVFFLWLILPGLENAAVAQWSHDPLTNNPLCTASGDQSYTGIISDGEGGAIVVWTDARGPENDLYAQRISARGIAEWALNGAPVCISHYDQTAPTMAVDGSGGATITWTDNRSGNYDIYAQRISGSGAILWAPGGVGVCTAPNDQVASTVVSDGAGGVIVTWRDLRGGSSYDIFAQRINASGGVRWTTNGVAVCTAPNRQIDPVITGDEAGGAIIAWLDNRSGKSEIYAQHVSAAGISLWDLNGIVISKAANDQRTPGIAADGTGGAIITWRDVRNRSSYGIFAQRVNAAGLLHWAANGVPVCAALGEQGPPVMIADGLHGGIIAWSDHRNGNSDIYAQRIDIAGVVHWGNDGTPLCKAAGDQVYPVIASDGLGGATVAWLDYRRGDGDIYAQRINALGSPQWPADGTAICTSPGEQLDPVIVSGENGGAVIAWYDYRFGANSDIFAQLVDRVGYLGDASPRIAGIGADTSGGGRRITLMWNHSYVDTWPGQTVSAYTIWRGLKPTPSQRVASGLDNKPRRSEAGSAGGPPAGAAFVLEPSATFALTVSPNARGPATGDETIFWEFVATVKPHWVGGYSYSFSASPGAGGDSHDYFMVTALTSDPLVFWDSEVQSGSRGTGWPPPGPTLSLARPFLFPPPEGTPRE